LAVIRVSGPEALLIRDRIFQSHRGKQKDFMATLGFVVPPDGDEPVDEALCTFFPQGKSFTGEPSFEMSLHGNPNLAQRTLDVLVAAGCRLARPGEFTLRAFLTGKIDLCAAESVLDLIGAGSEVAAHAALRGLKGGLSDRLAPVRQNLIHVLAQVEARMDFPEEDLGAAPIDDLKNNFTEMKQDLDNLMRSAPMGQRLIQGARVILFGPPNAGKSTLLNALIGESRALVYDQPGTTRDVLEANWVLDGMPVLLVDVAGIRPAEQADPVEQMGIEKAKVELLKADLIIGLSECVTPAFEFLKSQLATWGVPESTPTIWLRTKTDLEKKDPEGVKGLGISAQTGSGLQELCQAMQEVLCDGEYQSDEVFLTRNRQKEEVQACLQALHDAEEALAQGWADEVLTSEVRRAGQALDRLLGADLNEEVLDKIFSEFCIGK
jgi:tRNA modification GTPase